MQIQKTTNTNFGKGIYFSHISNICFNKTAKFTNKEGVKISEEGYKYIEQTQLSKQIKDKFKNNKFIKNISEKFDTFIWFEEIQKNKSAGLPNVSMAKVMWHNPIEKYPQIRPFLGTSNISKEDALEKMFNKIC